MVVVPVDSDVIDRKFDTAESNHLNLWRTGRIEDRC